jgi:hypothetical protein
LTRPSSDAGGVALMIEGVLKPSTSPSTGLAAFTEIVLKTPDVFATYASMQERGITFRRKRLRSCRTAHTISTPPTFAIRTATSSRSPAG